ncbi:MULTISPECIES: hypothetical protein [Pseudonocardia]|uniref:Tripartite tricarboxylate transporter TctB family protein n=2 Tax=Pseudonocardia TaxID=1847 RepID=A0A1Y2MLI3_PSEAH|nr:MULTISPECIES: hypothetical protein [Pseudonocardia]OSY36135.1 hypothetical protein BG845_05650 [Pseudonocardia autotrophica]TDN77617.1 hypothetical protein C8E95_6867 [Pseudonocardia autotrophica]BBG01647.1 hypothetical protein Pdca_28560 [Pseudonocardia autotrophica]GEC25392.1 hypothetical protein PSA01_24210 [Pseudonocardia saturnea]
MLDRTRIAVGVAVLAGFLAAATLSLSSLHTPTYWFPAFVTVAGSLVAGYSLAVDLIKLRRGAPVVDGDITDIGASLDDGRGSGEPGTGPAGPSVGMRALAWTGWLIALPVLALFIPFFFAALLWLVAVTRLQSGLSWKFVVPATAVFAVLLNVVVVALDIALPPAIITGLG